MTWRVWLVYAVLLGVGVPWYWPAGDTSVWLGFPAWVTTAIAAMIASACYTAWLLRRAWPEEIDAREEEAES